MRVPFLRPQLPSLEALGAYYRLAEEARFFSNGGPCERLLRDRLSDYLGGVGCVPVNNATNGLVVAVRAVTDAAGTGDRPYVVVPSYTFVATAGAVRVLGHRPLFVDVDPQSWQLDAAALADALSSVDGQVAAVLATHTFGTPPPSGVQQQWMNACRAAGVPLVVDAAAGFGAVDGAGVRSGRSVVPHVYSFHATKSFAIGEGGLVTTTDDDLRTRIDALHSFGIVEGRIARYAGTNAKMDELHAASALAALDTFPDVLARRRAIAVQYRDRLVRHGFSFQTGSEGATWQAGYLTAPDAAVRDAVLAAGRDSGVGVTAYYERPAHRHPAFSDGPVHGSLAVTDELASRALALPMANDLTDAEVDRVVEIVEEGINRV